MMITAALAGLAAACGDADARDASPGAWGEGEAWRLEEVVRIGSADGGGPDEFAWIADVELDALGRVWIADGQQHQIRVFDSAGAHVRSIGRKGGGPEEFNGIAGMDWAPDGTLWVLDGGNMRFAIYDTAGKLVTTHRREVNITVSPWPLGFDAQGRFYDLASVTESEAPTKVVRFGPGMVPQDTFTVPAFPEQFWELRSQSGGNTSINRVNIPFSPRQVWHLDPAGNPWVAVNNQYRLERHRFDGTPERAVEGAAKPRPVTAEERERVLDGYDDFIQKGGKIDASQIPDTHALFDDFFFGEDETVWVKLATGRDVPAALDVFDRAGAYLGRVQGPTRISPSPAPAFRDGRMAAVIADEDHVPAVIIMRVEKPER
ncbi:MAG TPA: 6-bladed beta-propeller [Longimicrobium sp.]|nr:6-bladed beta-propeller [Longimicrobium sp.]